MKELCLFCKDKARTHRDSKPLTGGQRFNANISVLCASSLNSLLNKSPFLSFVWQKQSIWSAKPFIPGQMIIPLILHHQETTWNPPQTPILLWHPQGYLHSMNLYQLIQHIYLTSHLHFVRRCLFTCSRILTATGKLFSGLVCARRCKSQSKHSWATAAQTLIPMIDEFIWRFY